MKKSTQKTILNQYFIKLPLVLIIAVLLVFAACSGSKKININLPENASQLERYAASEIRKYIYLRTGELAEIKSNSQESEGIILKIDSALDTEEFSLKTENGNLTVSGGSDKAILYGAYELAEQLGIRFYLDGDVVPDLKIPFIIPLLDIQKKPFFSVRGIQPFHDFPEGPDWWNQTDYKTLVTQLPKLKMNFLGFHTYPERKDFNGEGNKAEPMVWIGTEDQFNPDGTVKSAYPVMHFNTLDHSWGYRPIKTSDYTFSTSQLYENDKYGPVYTMNTSGWPHTDKENIQIFNDFGKLQNDVFTYANSLGVKICIGTETSLTIPENVKTHLKLQGVDPESDEALKMVYTGMFKRIMKTHPLDYFWFWTPENWTWSEVDAKEIKKTKNDLQIAIAAAKEVGVPFKLATCGWVIGPPPDRAAFDTILPKDMTFSCINRNLGFEEIDEAFIRIEGREKWAIPWMEDDPGLILPQLWAGRMRRDAADALAYGCSGLIGIHWRTRELGPNVSALAKAAWQQSPWNPAEGILVNSENFDEYKTKVSGDSLKQRDLDVSDFYTDWAKYQFGENVGERIANIFVKLDGGVKTVFRQPFITNLPRPADWVEGPGGLRLKYFKSWEDAGQKFGFVDEMEKLQPEVAGAGNIERFNFWLNEFRYLKATTRLVCLIDEFNMLASEMKSLPLTEQKAFAEKNLVPKRIEEMKTLATVHEFLVQLVTSKGTLGNLTNWQQHVIPIFIGKQATELSTILGRELTAEEMPMTNISASLVNIISPTGTLEKGDDFKIEILSMNTEKLIGTISFRMLGQDEFQQLQARHVSRGVYNIEIPARLIQDDFEYYIEIKGNNKIIKTYPAGAPESTGVVTLKN
jgi:hypothetical protein